MRCSSWIKPRWRFDNKGAEKEEEEEEEEGDEGPGAAEKCDTSTEGDAKQPEGLEPLRHLFRDGVFCHLLLQELDDAWVVSGVFFRR